MYYSDTNVCKFFYTGVDFPLTLRSLNLRAPLVAKGPTQARFLHDMSMTCNFPGLNSTLRLIAKYFVQTYVKPETLSRNLSDKSLYNWLLSILDECRSALNNLDLTPASPNAFYDYLPVENTLRLLFLATT